MHNFKLSYTVLSSQNCYSNLLLQEGGGQYSGAAWSAGQELSRADGVHELGAEGGHGPLQDPPLLHPPGPAAAEQQDEDEGTALSH